MKLDGLDKLTRADIIDAIYNRVRLDRKVVRTVVELFIEEIKAALISDKVIELRGFGTFEVKVRKGRQKARNPKTGEIVSVHSHGIAAFRAGRDLKRDVWAINRGETARAVADEEANSGGEEVKTLP